MVDLPTQVVTNSGLLTPRDFIGESSRDPAHDPNQRVSARGVNPCAGSRLHLQQGGNG